MNPYSWIVRHIPVVVAVALASATGMAVSADERPAAYPRGNQVQLAASAVAEVPQDLLSITLSATREGNDAAGVQAQLKSVLEAALAQVRAAVRPGQLEVRTGGFSLYPRHNKEGRAIGWTGSAELVIEGRDIGQVAASAGRLTAMGVTGTRFALSREQQEKAEAQLQAEAIERFRARAQDIARGFGFSGYSLIAVQVGSGDAPIVAPRVRALAMAPAAMVDAPVPVEAGRSEVRVTVSGTVQLR